MRDHRHPWFAPLHRRVMTVAVCFAWLVYESFHGERIWQIASFLVFGYGLWALFIAYRPPDENQGTGRS